MCVCVFFFFLDRFSGSAIGLEKFLIELHIPLHIVEQKRYEFQTVADDQGCVLTVFHTSLPYTQCCCLTLLAIFRHDMFSACSVMYVAQIWGGALESV